MHSVAVVLIVLGILIGGLEGLYVLTHSPDGDVGYGWAVLGVYVGVALAFIGAGLALLDRWRNLRK